MVDELDLCVTGQPRVARKLKWPVRFPSPSVVMTDNAFIKGI